MPLLTTITGDWTVAAVWRVRFNSNGSATGHPFAPNGGSGIQFGDNEWREGMGLNAPLKVMNNIQNSPLGIVEGTGCLGVWDYQTSQGLRWALVTDGGGVVSYSGNQGLANYADFGKTHPSSLPTVGAQFATP